MIEYAKFLCKRTLCRKSNIVIFLSAVSIIFVFLIMNIKTQDRFVNMLNEQVETDREQIAQYKDKLHDSPEGSLEYQLNEKNIAMLESNMKTFQDIVMDYERDDWPAVYAKYGRTLEEEIKIFENSANVSDKDETSTYNETASIEKQLTYIRYLEDHHLDYEEMDFPVAALSFTTSISQFILPVIIAALCIYLLAQVYTLDYVKGSDISILLPISRNKVILTKILAGAGFSVMMYLMILLSSFMLASLLSANFGFAYPVIMQDTASHSWVVVSTLTLFKDWFGLGLLFCVSLSLFTYLLSLFIHEDVFLLLVVLCIVLGLAYLPDIVDSLKMIAHFLPTTYMNYVNVANGGLAAQYANEAVCVSGGIWVLTLSIVIQLMACVLVHKGRVLFRR